MLTQAMSRPLSTTLLLGATLVSAATFGCDTEIRSCDLETDQIILWATLTNSDAGVEVEVEFEAANTEGVALALCPERDRLEINGVEATLVRALGHLFYTAKFKEPAAGYELMFMRGARQNITMLVEMPPSFEILEPAIDSVHPRGAALDVAWTPAWPGGEIDLTLADTVGSDCIEGLGVRYTLEDTVSAVVGGNSLVSGAAVEDESPGCAMTLTLTRSTELQYPAAFHEGGRVSAAVRRRRPFTSVE
jgi:hypothetical protein